MPMSALTSSVFFFAEFRDRLIKKYDELFGQKSNESLDRVSNFGRKWGWYQSIYQLAGGDITRFENITELKVHKCFMMLAYMKDKHELETAQIKNRIK